MPGRIPPRTLARIFDHLLAMSARIAQHPTAHPLTTPLMRGFARFTLATRGAPAPGQDAKGLAESWQRMMPNRKMVPIITADAHTAHAEIRVHCPLRGTGDVHACHRLMEYDRTLLRDAGGRLVVLRSQAEPGVTTCSVAIRPIHIPADDLQPAHLRATTAPPSHAPEDCPQRS